MIFYILTFFFLYTGVNLELAIDFNIDKTRGRRKKKGKNVKKLLTHWMYECNWDLTLSIIIYVQKIWYYNYMKILKQN